MDLTTLEGAVRKYFAHGIAQSTSKAYKSAQKRYSSFCTSFNLPLLLLFEHHLCLFISYLASQGIKCTTLKVYLSGLRHLQISANLPDPFLPAAWPQLDYVLKGIRRCQVSSRPAVTHKRLPITASILRKLRAVWSKPPVTTHAKMLWAACLLGFFGFLRSGEFTVPTESGFDPTCHLGVADITVDDYHHPFLVQVTIKQSKTDPFRKGVQVYIGRTGDDLYPVAAMLSYLTCRGNGDGPLFKFSNQQPLTRAKLVSQLRTALAAAGLNFSSYSGHSFRIGAATTAAAQGLEDSLIQTLGRWQSTAYLRYIHLPRHELAQVSARLSRPPT